MTHQLAISFSISFPFPLNRAGDRTSNIDQEINMPTRPNLTVIRCADINASAVFYRLTGLEFEKHRHGTGPEHYAATDGIWTFELYPASTKFPASSSARVGFTVDSCDEVASRLQGAGFSLEVLPTDSPWGKRAVALDPDGHRVELTSTPNQ